MSEDRRFFAFAFVSWFILMVLAIVNAVIRQGFYVDHMNDLQAHQLSTFTLMVIIVVFTYLLLRFSGFELTQSQALTMGVVWLILTVAFEFIAGHYLFGNSWSTLLADYNVLKGRVWVLIPLTVLLAPSFIRRIT